MEPRNPIYSLYQDQPIYRELLSDFVSSVHDRISRSQSAFEQKSWKELAQTMHQLRGAAATFGYPGLAELSAKIEIASMVAVADELSIAQWMTEILMTCRRIEAGLKSFGAL